MLFPLATPAGTLFFCEAKKLNPTIFPSEFVDVSPDSLVLAHSKLHGGHLDETVKKTKWALERANDCARSMGPISS
jgi:hypothetical protein